MARLTRLALAAVTVAACAHAGPVRPQATAEQANLVLVKRINGAPGYARAAQTEHMTDDVEWWAAGDSVRLPWAGTRRGLAGVSDFTRTLRQHMKYDGFEARQFIAEGDRIAVVIFAHGKATLTGKSFASDVVRVYDFRDGKIARVRSFYDTDAYARAMAK